jgi:hypothetical protein
MYVSLSRWDIAMVETDRRFTKEDHGLLRLPQRVL